MIDVQAERVVVVPDPESSFTVRRTASRENPEALQGFHADNLLFLIDEASGIDEVVFEVGLGALSTAGARVVLASNPTRSSGFFYDTHHTSRDRWHTIQVTCLDVPRAQGHIEDIKATYGSVARPSLERSSATQVVFMARDGLHPSLSRHTSATSTKMN